ncbi:excalibur calcium-binding domain-containing protein [Microbacterium sp. 18062]|uniref:excalibur calcium-binding domain-containing protein n=1 Tax=Microbacterium sp. 18062 TaxID=2681410 RepID=UPI001358162A|nr:excalibur calcium-binding domain-containing protein [Microbacterium sp. 18062]
MAQQHPAAGWYPAPHAGDELRYWDGERWLDDSPPVSDAAASAPASAKGSFLRRTMSLKTATIIAASAFVVGMLISGWGGASGTAALEDRIDALESEALENAALAGDVEELGKELEEVDEARDAAAARVSELESELAAVRTESDARQARIVELEAAAVVVPVVEEPAAPEAPAAPPAATYYENCTAARAAGAAPVRLGDPGYARHLDRDGDGVGCE